MTTTYDITRDLSDLLVSMEYLDEQVDERSTEIEANGGVLPDDLAEYERALLERLDEALGEGREKLENLALVRRDLVHRRAVEVQHKRHMMEEMERYRRRERVVDRTIERLKRLSVTLFTAIGVNRYDGERIKTRVQRGSLSIRPADPNDPPHAFCVETWRMDATTAAALAASLSSEMLDVIDRRRSFDVGLVREAVHEELDTLRQMQREAGNSDFDWYPGAVVRMDDLGVVAEFGATVVDW